MMILNRVQAQELAKFFFDIAKGLVLGGVGFATVSSLAVKLTVVVASLFFAYIFVRMGLVLLKE